jgi:hypothetical protein
VELSTFMVGPSSIGPETASRSVPRIGRLLDLAGILLFAPGGGLFAWAWAGFRRVREYQPSLEDGSWAAIGMADGYWRLQKIGTALMVAGVAVFVLAWWVAGRARQSDSATPPSSSSRTSSSP